jgi:hypothetical protein
MDNQWELTEYEIFIIQGIARETGNSFEDEKACHILQALKDQKDYEDYLNGIFV